MTHYDTKIEHPIRVHKVVDEIDRTCTIHGPYRPKVWRLDPPVINARKEIAHFLSDYVENCPTCNTEWQLEADARDAEIRGGDNAKAARLAAALATAGIPARFKDSQVWNWQHGMDRQQRVWSWARDYCQQASIVLDQGRCGILCGAAGTGKTHLAIGILRHFVEKGGTGLYTTALEMIARIKDTFRKESPESEAQAVAHLTAVDLLVVDEVGRQLDSTYEQAQVFRILDARYRALKPTILVTNLNKVDIVKFLGEAIVDRMRESGGALHVFDWASSRNSAKRDATETE